MNSRMICSKFGKKSLNETWNSLKNRLFKYNSNINFIDYIDDKNRRKKKSKYKYKLPQLSRHYHAKFLEVNSFNKITRIIYFEI